MTFRQKIQQGLFVVTGEMGPPQSANSDALRKKVPFFRYGVDAVNITDNQTSIVRLSSIASARILLEEGLEPVVQMTCRDRNRIALQSDILGLAALGLSNLLCLTGDHQKFGSDPEARGVFDLDSVQLIAMAEKMRGGSFLSGEPIKTPPDLFIGGAANPFADPPAFRVLRLEKKISAGARFIQTQPVYDIGRFEIWMRMVRERGLHERCAILAGVMPVKSHRALMYMKEQVPGMRIPDDLVRRMQEAENPEEEGVRMAAGIISAVREIEGVRGIHLMPLLWEKITPVVLEASGLPVSGVKAGESGAGSGGEPEG